MTTDASPAAAEQPAHAHTLAADIARCVHCGFCLQACPTYVELGMETDSPRGRIALIDAMMSGRAEASTTLVRHLDLCLQCRACETACPSGVAFGRIMEVARAEVMEHTSQAPRAWRMRAAVLRALLPHPRRLAALRMTLWVYRRSPLAWLLRRTGVLSRLWPSLGAAEQSMPDVPLRGFAAPKQPPGLTRRVAMLSGCVMPHMYPRTHDAAVRVLNRLGYRVVFPAGQTCCGALSAHAGDRRFAQRLARRNIDAFLAAEVEAVVIDSAGCGAAMKEYSELLHADAAYAAKAAQLASITTDVLEFVAGRDLGTLGPIVAAVTYQDACHLAHAQRITKEPRELLARIPGVTFRELAVPDRCCGAAGIYNLVQREMSSRLLQHKMDDVMASDATIVCTANPGCMMQIEAGLRSRGAAVRVAHVIELVDEAMRAAGG